MVRPKSTRQQSHPEFQVSYSWTAKRCNSSLFVVRIHELAIITKQGSDLTYLFGATETLLRSSDELVDATRQIMLRTAANVTK